MLLVCGEQAVKRKENKNYGQTIKRNDFFN